MFGTTASQVRPEDGFESKYFKVKRDSGDVAFVQRLGCLPENRGQEKLKRFRRLSTREIIAQILSGSGCAPFMKIYQELAVKANDFSFFNKAVLLAANFVWLLYSEVGLLDYSCEDRLKSQLNSLWEYVSNEGKKGTAIAEVWKNTMLLVKSDHPDKYCFVQEPHVSCMIFLYALVRDNGGFDTAYRPYDIHGTVSKLPQLKERSLYEDICRALRDMDYFYTLTADDHTRLMVLLARNDFREIGDLLVSEFETFDLPSMPRIDNDGRRHEPLEDLHLVFDSLSRGFQDVIWEEMSSLVPAWSQLLPRGLSVKPAVSEVFEIADLRRRALGMRFITSDLFIWSFYKCGYALPHVIRDTLKLGTDVAGVDRPLSQTLRAAIKLVVSLGEKVIELEHLIFVFLYPNEIDVDVISSPEAYVQHFMNFIQGVEKDTKDRPQGTTSQDDFQYVGDPPNFKLMRFRRRREVGVA